MTAAREATGDDVRGKDIRVLIADDNRAVRRGLRVQFEQARGITVIAEAGDGADAVAIALSERPDVVLMDLHMPGLHGVDATRALAGEGTADPVAVIVMTSHVGDDLILPSIEAGAVGYLLKAHDSDQVIEAVRAAARGDALVSSRVTSKVLRELARHQPSAPDAQTLARLTPAERKAVAALAAGMTGNDDIATHLHVSVNTVRSHLHAAMKKIGVDDRTQLALWGARNRLSPPDQRG